MILLYILIDRSIELVLIRIDIKIQTKDMYTFAYQNKKYPAAVGSNKQQQKETLKGTE
jgi:hypothetical protein